MSAHKEPVEGKQPPKGEDPGKLRQLFDAALQKNPESPELLGPPQKTELPAPVGESGQGKGPPSTAEQVALRTFEDGVRKGPQTTGEIAAMKYQRTRDMSSGTGETPSQPEASVEQPPPGGGAKAQPPIPQGKGKGRRILTGLSIAAGILAVLGLSHMLNKPAAKMSAQKTSISSSISSTTTEAEPTTTTIPPTIEAEGQVRKTIRPEVPKEKMPDLKEKAEKIIKSAEGLPFKDALLTLRRYALTSKGSDESKDNFFDAMQELVDAYKKCKHAKNQENFDACREAMRNLGNRWTTISTEEIWATGGVP